MASFTLNYLFKTPNSKYRRSGLGPQHARVRAGGHSAYRVTHDASSTDSCTRLAATFSLFQLCAAVEFCTE